MKQPTKWCIPVACLALALALPPAPALAALAPSVQAVVTNAEKAFAAGQYDRASELFEQAYKAAPAEATLLYNAARAAQLGKLYDRAEALFVQFLALKDRDAKYAEKATGYLPSVRSERDLARATEAKAKAKDGENMQRDKRYSEASAAYRDAYRLQPTNFEYLFRAGSAAALGCDETMAKQYLADYLKRAPADAADRTEAQARLVSMATNCKNGRHVSESEHVVKVVEEHSVRDAAPVAAGGTSSTGLYVAVGGGALALAGAGLFAATVGDAADLAAATQANSAGKIDGTYYDDAVTRTNAINQSRMIAGALGGAGLVGAGVGLWLMMKAPAKVVVLPAADGVLLSWRF